ncbi:alpha-glucuronidase family glycosyl hydrolase [Jiulongibacter sediminis]|uniref:Xylan alpha-1,2-glucuronidase n=1 Tax=Jiulongibacter sediminis TaxID=1605367 RepID=A0A0P7BMZ3_9BACT|nr:alpha-glucuronidase family glycosyl hydrolase [Jiulongibacter sediminis]KPM48617.1 alpha-glucuronidase [Jiulongibacter sediminis]TBX25155.1 alpha-glucuronidase [Jiulongibacter sediminis]
MKLLSALVLSLISFVSLADDGSRLWLKYDLIQDEAYRKSVQKAFRQIIVLDQTETTQVAADELQKALSGFTGKTISINNSPANKSIVLKLGSDPRIQKNEGFTISSTSKGAEIISPSDEGLLYGAFALIRRIQTGQSLDFELAESPKVQVRMLNHWDNANGTVERGYAGSSIWKWFELPYRIDPRYIEYARANASIGINAASINNVNASSRFLTAEYLEKIKAVADVLRPYGIKVFISVNFRSPRTLGGLETSDPLDPGVRQWWKYKTEEIHRYIPDFGGYLVKANSEGEPGPQDYGRTHADGANMLADAMKGHEGVVIWRAFVYEADPNGDRFKEAFNQFKPLDGTFHPKVIVQVKNGPIDFMPREPFHPMFGVFPKTPLAMEFQITQEYLGHSTHLTYLAPMFEEVLDSDTYAKGEGSTVGKVIDGSLNNYQVTVMAGVANTGSDANWTGHPFGQSNWYAFGRLAWDHTLSSEQIAEEWTKMTLTKKPKAVKEVVDLMMKSHPTYVKYTYPLGLAHMMGEGHHYGPQPWLEKSGRPDWTSVYYHRTAKDGIGFDRTGGMSDALSLYSPDVQKAWGDPQTMDLNYLLWFHHLDWDYELPTGKTVWNELMTRYYQGVDEVEELQKQWNSLKPYIDQEIFENVKGRLAIQHKEALWWRDSCYLYFKQFSEKPLPVGLEEPKRTLEDVKELEHIYHLR